MGNKMMRDYVCLNKKDKEFLDNTYLEDILDVEGKKNKPIRSENVRKAIEQHFERLQLKNQIVDFDLYDEH